MPNAKWMTLAIKTAREGMKKSEGGPFGAVIVRKGKPIAFAHNTVLKKKDPTAHAEINAIRKASRVLRKFDLSDCVLYSTTEPCPMCFAAIHWARIPLVVFGTSIWDVKKLGFNELSIPNTRMKCLGKSPVQIRSGFMLKDCRRLLADWDAMENRRVY